MYGGLWINFQTPHRLCLQDVAEDQSGRRESRLTPSQSGCISVAPPPTLPFPHLVASPVRMMSLTAVNTVSMETPTTALAYISGSSPSILQHHPPPLTSHTLRPLLATQPSHPSSDENRREVGGGFGGGPHGCGQEERHGQKGKKQL